VDHYPSSRPYSRNYQGNRYQDDRPARVRLIDETGQMLGVMPFKEALQLSYDKSLDLVEVSPDASPPVYKLCDYNRLKFLEKKKKDAQRKPRIVVKEVQIRPTIQENDFQVKVSNARKFLKEQDKVKVVMQFRGRELSFADMGKSVIARFIQSVEDLGKPESNPKLEGKRMIMVLAPLKASEIAEREAKAAAMESIPEAPQVPASETVEKQD
jgi:translation initiation factor IF-3